jgi:hypothetical protein
MALPRFALVAHGPPRSRSTGLRSGAPRSTALLENHAGSSQIRAVRDKTFVIIAIVAMI